MTADLLTVRDDRDRCRACGAPILWALTVRDRAMPVDPDPRPDGNVELYDDPVSNALRARVLGPLDVELAKIDGTPLRWPHHATCPHADRFRRRR